MLSNREERAARIRKRLVELAEERGESLAELSRMIRRNPAYLQQFVRRGTPDLLDEDDRLLLARHFDIDERELGARDPYVPALPRTFARPQR